MILRYFKAMPFIPLILVLFAINGFAQTTNEGHILVSLRMIGHQIMLQAGDSTSRILPVVKEDERYKVAFTSDFQFDPEQLVSLVSAVVEKSQIAKSYLVEMESCLTKQVVYSYEIGNSQKMDLVSCKGRIQPKGCYLLYFTILSPGSQASLLNNGSFESTGGLTEPGFSVLNGSNYSKMVISTLAALMLVMISLYFRKKNVTTPGNPNLITLGEYLFDSRNMELRRKEEVVELTSKESDLLLLLYNSVNSTLERELILKAVWGDEGDYIGRTLDVFISKLRKKLEADSSLKIVNVRGVGYKLILNE